MQRRLRVGIGLTTLAVVAVAAWLVSPAVALAWLSALASRPVAFGIVVLAIGLVRPILAWPTSLLSIAVGYGYGLVGIPFAVGLLTLTSIGPYWVGTLSDDTGRITTTGQQFIAATGGVRGVAAARLFPLPSDVISVAAGAARVRFQSYLLGTALGESPWAVLGVLVGVSVGRLQHGELTTVVDPWLLVGMTAIAIVLLAGPCYRLFSSKEPIPTQLSADEGR